MYAIMSGWWTVSTVAKSRALNASSPFFMTASRRAVRLVSVEVDIMTPFPELFEVARGPAEEGGDENHSACLLECTLILVHTPTIVPPGFATELTHHLKRAP